MGDFEYQVTAVTFGLGLQRGSTRTVRLNEHIREVASDGWQFVAVDHSAFEIPLAWRFFWERRAGVLPPETRAAAASQDFGIKRR